MRLHSLVCLLALLIGCLNPSGSEVNVHNYGDEFDLKLGKKAIIGDENETVEFVDVLGDSRCPINVNCVWAGNGEVEIRFSHTNIQLNTYLEPQDTTISGSRIELLSLDPYPEYPEEIDKDDYKVRLLITRE